MRKTMYIHSEMLHPSMEHNIKMYLTFWGNKILSENARLEKKIKKKNLL